MLFFFQWGKKGANGGLRRRVHARSGIQGSQPRAPTLRRCESLYRVPELTFSIDEPRVVIGHFRSLVGGGLLASPPQTWGGNSSVTPDDASVGNRSLYPYLW